MNIDTAPPAQEPRRSSSDRDAYIYGSGSGSFIAVLTEVRTVEASRNPRPASVDSEKSARPVDDGEAVAEEAGGTESVETEAVDTVDEQSVPDSEVSAEPETSTPDQADGPALAAESVDGPSPDEAPVVVATNQSPTLPGATDQAPIQPSTPGSAVASTIAPEVPTDRAPETGASANASDANLAGIVSEGDDAPLEDGNPASPPFPKTLNALLAEKAVSPRNIELPDARDGIKAIPDSRESVENVKHQTESNEIIDHESPPLPQSTATEVGGVRVSSTQTTPRIPLSNLPGEIAQQIHLLQKEGTSTMRLRLQPENLGELRLEIHRSGDNIRVTMSSPSPQVRDALDSQMAELRKALEQQGFNLEEASVGDGAHRGAHDTESDRARGDIRHPGASLANSPPGGAIKAVTTPVGDDVVPGGLNVLA